MYMYTHSHCANPPETCTITGEVHPLSPAVADGYTLTLALTLEDSDGFLEIFT